MENSDFKRLGYDIMDSVLDSSPQWNSVLTTHLWNIIVIVKISSIIYAPNSCCGYSKNSNQSLQSSKK